ncbi:hypothetical protein ONA70_10410 [Micromonospora yasonensis]|uniref:hypothetical protein n=1 Tax=Micromonospora yasonensis TaxID=1128667 RepID=UPI0022310C2B|nr:hypothetical protein [Micromonospora yasonensis]MCW3840507.1 hypothetical protein [Micromonospora yasonensis]
MSVEPAPVEPDTTRNGRSSFWTSLPGLLTAISGLLTAILAVCAFIYQVSGWGDDTTTNSNTSTDMPASTNHSTTATKAASSPTAAAGTEEPLWQNKLLFGSSGVDFDTVPPTVSPGDGMDFYDADAHQIAPLGSTALLAKWTGAGTPTAADCAELLSREGVSKTQTYFQGAKFCARSKETHMVVLIAFVGPKSGEYQIDVTVWAPRD